MPVHQKDDAKERLITIEFKDGKPLVIVTAKYEGVTPQMWGWYQDGLVENVTKIDKANEMKLLEDNGDTRVVHQRIITPTLVSNRSHIMTMWSEPNFDGKSLYLATSVGNEELEKKYAKNLGKDGVSLAHLTYTEVEACEGGIKIVFVLHIDVAGSLPDFVKTKIGQAQAEGCDKIIEFIRKNYKA